MGFHKTVPEDISPFCGTAGARFGILMTSALGFKARVDPPPYMLCDLNIMDSSDSLLVWHLLRLLAASKAA